MPKVAEAKRIRQVVQAVARQSRKKFSRYLYGAKPRRVKLHAAALEFRQNHAAIELHIVRNEYAVAQQFGYFFGNGAAKCMEAINHPNARLIEGIEPLGKYMYPLAERKFLRGETEDVAYFVPFYLKDFVAKVARNPLEKAGLTR